MAYIWAYTLASVFIVSLMSLIGIFTLAFNTRLLNRALLYMVGFSAGAMLGDVFIHLLPGIAEEKGFTLIISLYVLIGIFVSFVVEKVIHWHHCHHSFSDKDHCHHGKHHQVHAFAVMNLVGDGIHNFIDGLIVAAGYLVSIQVGIATTIAVILHEIPQEIGDFGVLLHGGFTKAKALSFNFVTAATSILGAIIALLLSARVEDITEFLIPFAAGTFIYIASADLIPEMHKESSFKKSLLQALVFVLGIAVMSLLLFLE